MKNIHTGVVIGAAAVVIIIFAACRSNPAGLTDEQLELACSSWELMDIQRTMGLATSEEVDRQWIEIFTSEGFSKSEAEAIISVCRSRQG